MSRRAQSSKRHLNRRRGRSRLRLFLTESETAELDRAVRESGALFRSLIIAEAIQAGLAGHADLVLIPQRRCRRVDVWMPKETEKRVRQVAAQHKTSQQELLRHLLFEYIRNGPWKANETGIGSGEVAAS